MLSEYFISLSLFSFLLPFYILPFRIRPISCRSFALFFISFFHFCFLVPLLFVRLALLLYLRVSSWVTVKVSYVLLPRAQLNHCLLVCDQLLLLSRIQMFVACLFCHSYLFCAHRASLFLFSLFLLACTASW
jgi:hypothetical protein